MLYNTRGSYGCVYRGGSVSGNLCLYMFSLFVILLFMFLCVIVGVSVYE